MSYLSLCTGIIDIEDIMNVVACIYVFSSIVYWTYTVSHTETFVPKCTRMTRQMLQYTETTVPKCTSMTRQMLQEFDYFLLCASTLTCMAVELMLRT